jgi:hypothetical protein
VALATGSSIATTAITAGGTAAIYTVSTTTYSRDLVIANQSTAASSQTAFTMFVGCGSGSVSTTAGFAIPANGQMVLQGQVGGITFGTGSGVIYATAASAVTAVVGGGSVVSVI